MGSAGNKKSLYVGELKSRLNHCILIRVSKANEVPINACV